MSSMMKAIRQPYDFIRSSAYGTSREKSSLWTRPVSIGGMVCLGLCVAAFVWMYPELKRYLKMRQM